MANLIQNVGIPVIVAALLYIGRKLQVLDGLEKTTGKIKSNVKVISDYLVRAHPDFSHDELQAYSPLKLTPGGKKLIKDLGFDNVFEQYKNEFFDFIDHDEPKQKYDVEVAAIKSISVFSNNDYMGFLKTFFYNNPERSIQNTAPTLGVYVRDKYLAEHTEITE